MNPLLWILGGVGLFAVASSGPSAPRPRPPAATPPSSAPSSGKGAIAFTQGNIDKAIAIALAHEQNPANLQAFGLALAQYGWTKQAAALLAKAQTLQTAATAKVIAHATHGKPATHAPPAHHAAPMPYTITNLHSLIAQTKQDLQGSPGFGGAPTGSQKATLEHELAHYEALLASLEHHATKGAHH